MVCILNCLHIRLQKENVLTLKKLQLSALYYFKGAIRNNFHVLIILFYFYCEQLLLELKKKTFPYFLGCL